MERCRSQELVARAVSAIAAGTVLWSLGCFSPESSHAKGFRIGDVDGVVDITLAYGLLARTEDRDPDFIGIANGGNAPSVNNDDGTLNYDKGLVANELRFSGDLTLVWRNFGLFARGYGFYDFETKLGDRAHSDLSDDADKLVGAGGKLQEYYLSARFFPFDIPVQVRVGDQVINWGESNFLRFGADVVNPVDFVSLLQPTASTRDFFVPQGMVWAASNITELIAIEGFYQYRWEPIIEAPVGWFFSANDLLGGDGINQGFAGMGQFSDLGTQLDDGLDEEFMRIPGQKRFEPRNSGQYGFTIQALVPALNSSTFGLHFMNFHSRLPLISGFTSSQAAIDTAAAIAEAGGDTTLALGKLTNSASYLVTYPEDIKMLGFSFNTATISTGTLLTLELSHHFNAPVQQFQGAVLAATLSPITGALTQSPPGPFGADELVDGIDETHKTQLAVGIAQAFGPRLWSSRSRLSLDIGYIHHGALSEQSPFDDDSWGYRIAGGLSYEGVLGGLKVNPFAAFTHDVTGTTPIPKGAFIEGRKTISAGVNLNWTNTVTAGLVYVAFLGGKPFNAGVDRDFLSFNLRYYY